MAWYSRRPLPFFLGKTEASICLLRHNNVQGGGVGMYFRDSVQYRILKEQSVMFDKVYESIFAEVINSSKKKVFNWQYI